MRLTTRGRYAVTALLDLALQPTEQTITLAEIAARQTISVAYLEQLFAKLKRHGLVSSVRGANGGYHLARKAEEITMLEIIEAVNETVDATRCDHKNQLPKWCNVLNPRFMARTLRPHCRLFSKNYTC